jgi:hypothetical protein
MGIGKRIRSRFHALRVPDATPPVSSATVIPPQLAQQASSPSSVSPPSPTVPNRVTPAPTAPQNLVLNEALEVYLKKLPNKEKVAFTKAYDTKDEQTLLSDVQQYDEVHKDSSSFRPQAERLSKILGLLNSFMGGVAIGIQASPEISSLVVGAVRIVIDLALKFTTFFSRLTDMVCTFEDYLGPLAEYAKSADTELLRGPLCKAYESVIDFGWKARRVFVDVNDNPRPCTSLRAFLHQHWEPFESDFLSIREDLKHSLELTMHSVQALHYNALLNKDKSKPTSSSAMHSHIC